MAREAEEYSREKVLEEARAAVEEASRESTGRRKKRKEKREREAAKAQEERKIEEALAQGVNPEDLDAIKVSQGVTVQELAEALDVPANDIIKRLFLLGTPLTMTQSMSDDLVELVADDLGRQIFSASSGDDKSAEEMLKTDFKEFHIAGHYLGVSQITCIDSKRMMERKDEFLAIMKKTMEERGYTLMILMLTDVLLEGTQILYIGDEEIFSHAFNTPLKDHTCFLPGVVSRKKQIIPMLSALWG